MKWLVIIALTLGLSTPANAESLTTKALGLSVELFERLSDTAGGDATERFRFVAPEFTGTEPFDALVSDLESLCETVALPALTDVDPLPDRVVISLANQPTEFGAVNRDVPQVFEVFSVRKGACMLELF